MADNSQLVNNMYPALLTALIVTTYSVTGRYNISLEGKIKNTNCFLSQKTVELLGDAQSLQKFSIKKLNQLNFKILFKGCHDHELFLFCSNKAYLPISFFPLHKINLYLDLPSNLTSYLLILDIFRSHSKIIFREPTEFFYESINVSDYKQALQSSAIFKSLDFGAVFSPGYNNKSGYIALLKGQFVLLETLPYHTKSAFMLFKTYRVKYLLSLDNLSLHKLKLLTTIYSQIQTLASPLNVPTNKTAYAATAQFALKANIASTAKVAQRPKVSPSKQNLTNMVSRRHHHSYFGPQRKPRSRRSVWDYFFGISASEVEDEMNTHFADLTSNVENEFTLERTVSNKIINLLNEEEAEINVLKQNQDRLIQKMNLDLLFNNENLLEKYTFFIQKNNVVLDHLLTSYEKILEILVETLRPSEKKIQCGFAAAFGENSSCLNLQNSFVEEDFTHFHVFLEAFPLVYQTFYKVTCEIEQNSTIINALHMKVFRLTELNNVTTTQHFRLLEKSDLIDNAFLILTKSTAHGLSCKKSTILFVNKKEIFCTTKVHEFFPDIASIQYERGGRNLIHSLADKTLLNNSLPNLDLALFNKLNFDNVSSRLDTMADYIRHNFHPIKRYKDNPVELVYHFVGTILVLLIVAVIILFGYCCIKNIIIPAAQNSDCCRRVQLPDSIRLRRNRNSIENSLNVDSRHQCSTPLQDLPTTQVLSASQSTSVLPVRPPRQRDGTRPTQTQPDQQVLGPASDLQPNYTSTRPRRQVHVSSIDEQPRLPNNDQPPSYDSSVEVTRSGRPRVSVNSHNLTLPRRSHSARRNTPLNEIIFGTSDNL